MNVSDVAEQIVAMQAQMLRASMALATVENASEQQQSVATLLTEASGTAAARRGQDFPAIPRHP